MNPPVAQPFSPSQLHRSQRRRKAVIAVLACAFALPLSVSAPMFAHLSLAGLLIQAASLACIALAVFIRVWSAVYVGGRKQRELVDRGPYALVRNPLYVGTIIGAVGIGLAFGSILVGLAMGLATFLVFDWIVRLEERRLRDEFGAAFDGYLAKVPRWWPSSFAFEAPPRFEVDSGVVVRTCGQALLFMGALLAASAIDAAHAAGWIATLIRLP